MPYHSLPRSVDAWALYLAHAELPVLGRTAAELARLAADEDRVGGPQLARVILHDPMMTLKVLRYLQSHRGKRQNTDITTIEHAVMMLGLRRFFAEFSGLSAFEDKLAAHPPALHGALRVLYRARHAALYAREWAVMRHDIEVSEVVIAALLHDLAEMLIWCFAPDYAQNVESMQQADRTLRSRDAQHAVLGFALIDLQLALVREWNLPPLFLELMDEAHATRPRVINVALAARIARHSSHGWHNPALADDYEAVRKFLGVSQHEVTESVRRATLAAAREWRWYNVAPAAAYWPLLPNAAPAVRAAGEPARDPAQIEH